MSDQPNSGGIDADKIVNRLLDIIQQQQKELILVQREKAEREIVAIAQGGVPERFLSVRSVVPSVQTALTSAPAASADVYTPRTFLETVKSNIVFIIVVAVISTGLLVLALGHDSPQIAQLNAQVLRAEDMAQAASAREAEMHKASDEEIVDLQKKLSATEQALSQNEKALSNVEDTLRSALSVSSQKPNPVPSPASLVSPQLPKIQFLATQKELSKVSNDIDKNKKELLSTLRTLGTARNALAIEVINERLARGEAVADISASNDWESYLTEEDRRVPPNPIERFAGSDPALDPFPSGEADLRERLSDDTQLLADGEKTLRIVQSRIVANQQAIIRIQDEIAKKQALVLRLRSNSEILRGNTQNLSSEGDSGRTQGR